MLFTIASWDQPQDCPFAVDSTSLVLKVKSHAIDMNSLHSPEFMPLNHLAYLAEECESAVFGVPLNGRYSFDNGQYVSGKVMGLICLSQLHSDWPTTVSVKQSNGADAALVVASMTALNLLESSIRSLVLDYEEVDDKKLANKKVGAPLLRDMIELLSKLEHHSDTLSHDDVIDFKTLASLLRALLLPTRLCGINLRNLVSHGFLSTIDRRWFALVVVLIQTLDHYVCTTNGVTTLNGSNLRKYESMRRVISHGQQLLLADRDRFLTRLSSFVPPTHLHLTQFIFETLAKPIQQSLQPRVGIKSADLTTIFLIASSSLLEHSLRLHWCRANNKPDEQIARPSRYYVTLDGHGQRDKHDIVISPYLRDGSMNQLINEIGASASLVQDLFSAPSVEAPNIRSQLCHGALDAEVIQELESLACSTLKTSLYSQAGNITTLMLQNKNAFLTDAACAITTSMDLISSSLSGEPKLMRYEPIYSYAAMWRRDLMGGIEHLAVLTQHVSNDLIATCINEIQLQLTESSVISYELEAFGVQLNLLRRLQQDHFSCPLATPDAEKIWLDYDFNIALSECISAQTLLNEVSDAAKRYSAYVERAIDVLGGQPTSTKEKRRLKTTKRMCGIASITLNFYSLAIYVSLVTVQNAILVRGTEQEKSPTRSECIRVVERTRMTLSTFDGYMEKNIERSLRAISQYLEGKALKAIFLKNNKK